jgi:hypothetical protein
LVRFSVALLWQLRNQRNNEKADTDAIGWDIVMGRYGTLQAPEFEEQDRLANAPVEKPKSKD